VLTVTTTDLARLTGVPEGTVKTLRAAGHLRPARPGRPGPGVGDRWSLTQALALAVSRGLRHRGVTSEEAGRVLNLLWHLSRERLEAQLAGGRTCLMVVGRLVMPRLVSRAAVLANEQMDYEAAQTVGLLPCAVDVAAVWGRLLEEVERLPASKKALKNRAKRR
jgi:hypothetical protein